MRDKYFYKKWRERINSWFASKNKGEKIADYAFLLPDLIMLFSGLMFDKRVSTKEKLKIGGLVAYLISPIDLIPEALFGPVGYLDDIIITILALKSMLNNIDIEVIRDNWGGKDDILDVMKNVLDVAGDISRSKRWERIEKIFNRLERTKEDIK